MLCFQFLELIKLQVIRRIFELCIAKTIYIQDITSLIISINNYTVELFSKRRKNRFQSSLAGNCQKILNNNIRNSLPLAVAVTASNLYLVEGKFKVSLNGKICECNQGYDIVIIFKHICAVFENNHVEPFTFVSKSYFTTTYYSQ
ncbi:hypothetical protein CDIK_2057 [Cucumispora dikerogammari]|nr:hypothetical protein CDIK_2057 [Cucumispora dikerogammari]